MTSRQPARRTQPLFALAALLLALAAPLHAQQPELSVAGTVTGPSGAPQPELRVVLHRVDATGGATVAETTSGPDGGFVLTAPASTDTAAVYFIAARYEGELYIGPPFRPGPEAPARHALQVGVAATSATALLADAEGTPPPMGRPATPTSWLLLLVPLLGVSAAVIYFVVPRPRIAADRALYIRIAEIDERIDGAPQGQRDSMRQERARLIEQLRTG